MFVTNSFLFHKTLRLAAGGGAYAITGRSVDVRRLNALSAARRTYAVTGQSSGLRKASRIGLVTGAYAVAGQTVQLKRQLKLSASPASMAIAGQLAGLQKSRVSGFVKTDFAITGQAVGLKRHLTLAVTAASISAAFQNVGLLKVAGQINVISADAALIGLDVQLIQSRRLASSLATLAVAAQQVNLRRNYPIAVQTAAFALAGVSVVMQASKRLSAVKANYNIASVSTGLTYQPKLASLSYISESHDTAAGTASLALPAGVTAGDLLVCYYRILSATDATPSGWTKMSSQLNSAGSRHNWFYRIATGSDSAMPHNISGSNVRRVIFLFRGNIPVTGVSVAGVAGQTTDGDPTAQVQPSNTGPNPKIVLASWANDNLATVSPRNMTPAKTAEVSPGTVGIYAGFRLMTGAANGDTTVDMDDEGTENVLTSLTMLLS